ncbi:type II secretion system F family protein [bacterium]|nr:type II secretion system F family protein [bacterium]
MAIYRYLAKNKEGETISGRKEAVSIRDLAQKLSNQGFLLISASLDRKKQGFLNLKRVSLKEKMMAIRNLQVMLAAGVSLPKSLDVLTSQSRNKYFQKILQEIKEKIIQGNSFSEALAEYPRVFPKIFSSMIKVGEKTGSMPDVLNTLASHLEKDFRLRSKVKGALMYPMIVVIAMILIGVVMLVLVVPKLSEAFKSLNIELPKTTRLIMNLGNYFKDYWYLLLAVPLLIAGFIILLKRSPKFKNSWDRFVFKIPFVSSLIKKINTAYSARTLSSLISGGVSIVEALQITSETVSNEKFREVLIRASKEVKKGEKLSSIIAQFPEVYPPVFVQMLEVGEETGQTSKVLLRLAEFFDEEVTSVTQNLASIIEPILLLVIGGIIALFAVSMIKPIYSMIGTMH